MSGFDGSHLHVQAPPAVSHGPQILRPAHNRHFPLPTAAEARLYARLQAVQPRSPLPDAAADKSKIPPANSSLKPTMKTEGSIRGITAQGNKEEISIHTPPIGSASGGKQRSRKSKHKRLLQQALGTVDGVTDPLAANSCRYDSSLSLLTKKFVNLLQQQEDGTLDLNRAAELLEVQKRRIYDITNVLEGVGLMEKSLKNRIRWKGDEIMGPIELDNQIAELKVAIDTLFKEECRIDRMIREMQENLRVFKEESNLKLLYLTKEDINNLSCFENSMLIAVKAPHGTSIEVPDPDEGLGQRRYQILLRSSMGPINCFLISNVEERHEASSEGQQTVPIDLSADNSCGNRDDGSSSHPTDQTTAKTLSPMQETDSQKIFSDPLISDEHVGGIMRIVPHDVDADADYWFDSDLNGSLTDMWNECRMMTADGAT